MMGLDGQLVLSAGLLTTFTMEIIKYVWRKYVVKDDAFDFPPAFYEMLVPFFTALWSIALGLMGFADPVEFEPMVIVQWALTILVSTGLYILGVKPTVTYRKEYEAKK